MENAEEIYHYLEEFSKRKSKTIPQELNEYLAYVARTGDPVYQWALVKSLFKEKLLSVITDFHDTTPGIEIPPYPNVDPFNYDIMKNSLLERLDSFSSAPFTVQRICELLTCPRKQYNRIDKFMRAVEKNILVVSTREPGIQRHPEPENGESVEPIVNGSDNNSEYNVDVEMEDMSWKDSAEQKSSEPQPGSSDAPVSVDDSQTEHKTKDEIPMEVQDKTVTPFESVTPPDLNVATDESSGDKQKVETGTTNTPEDQNMEVASPTEEKPQDVETEPKIELPVNVNVNTIVVPEIKIDDAEMTEQKLCEQNEQKILDKPEATPVENQPDSDSKIEVETPSLATTDDSSSDSKDEPVTKSLAEVLTSSEESSSSSDNNDGNSNSPKPECRIEVQEESSQSDVDKEDSQEQTEKEDKDIKPVTVSMESDNYSISDVNSVIPQPPIEIPSQESAPEEEKKDLAVTEKVAEENTPPDVNDK